MGETHKFNEGQMQTGNADIVPSNLEFSDAVVFVLDSVSAWTETLVLVKHHSRMTWMVASMICRRICGLSDSCYPGCPLGKRFSLR